MAKVSVVIPCYNQGCYVKQAIDSVLNQTYQDLEIIVVNDGSTDNKTNDIIAHLKKEKTTVITTENQGLAAARNNGIRKATGDYILPLDADDYIAPEYIEEAVAVLDNDPEVGIVYCRAELFGAVNSTWNLPDYTIEEMVKDNVIFCTALFRRVDWQDIGGYDPGMIYGWEDYDFWLSLIERGRKVRRLEKYYFFYRVSSDSMVRTKEKWQKIEMFKRIFQRHSKLFGENIGVWLDELLDIREKYYLSRLYINCGKGFRQEKSIALKIDPGTKQLVFEVDSFSNRTAIRFDPADCPVSLRIHSIKFIGPDFYMECDEKKIFSNALCQNDSMLIFDTDDPQIFLNVNEHEINQTTKIIVEIDFRSFGEDALHEMIDVKKNESKSRALKKLFFDWRTK